jgi:hypothetical protein
MANLRTGRQNLETAQVLDVQRAYDSRPDHRLSERLRIIYSTGGDAHEVRASVSWQALAQLRSEMARNGHEVSDDDVLGLVLVPWAIDQALLARRGEDAAAELRLDFGDAPRPPAVRETLRHYGLLG